jgi:hypothetical protein
MDLDDPRSLALVHAPTMAMIEKSALVTTAFSVAGKQILRVRPPYASMVDTTDEFWPPLMSQLVSLEKRPVAGMPKYWSKWPTFDYLYLLVTERHTQNPVPDRLTLLYTGDGFQLYRIKASRDSIPAVAQK